MEENTGVDFLWYEQQPGYRENLEILVKASEAKSDTSRHVTCASLWGLLSQTSPVNLAKR